MGAEAASGLRVRVFRLIGIGPNRQRTRFDGDIGRFAGL